MKRVSLAGVVIIAGLLSAGRAGAAVDLGEYRGAVSGLSVSVGRGLTLANDELEAARTESLTLGIDLANRLRLSVPFEKYDVDTRGREEHVLPIGGLHVRTIGAMLRLQFGGGLAPYIGLGANFYSFDEMFGGSPANVFNSFGAEGAAGLRFTLLDDVLGLAELAGSVGYQFSWLRPDVSVPGRPEATDVDLDRHSIVLSIELNGGPR